MVESAAYQIKLHKAVLEINSRRSDVKTKDKIKKKCVELLSKHPDQAGDSLQRELHGYRKLKVFDDYRIVYRVDLKQKMVYILAVGIRRSEEVYQDALKRNFFFKPQESIGE